MNLQKMGTVEGPDFHLDVAFRAGKKKADNLRGQRISPDRVKKSKHIEVERVKAVDKSLARSLGRILLSFPNTSDLSPFYVDLMKITIDYARFKKGLGAVNWAIKQCRTLHRTFSIKIKRSDDIDEMNEARRSYYGRISSVLKQIKKELAYLETARKIMRDYPNIKTAATTVALAGYPNVGKSSLLRILTSAKPEVKSYAFTTKQINLGYYRGKSKVQLVDTPGVFDRKLEKMNAIEQQSYLVLKHLAEQVFFVMDPTLSCGFSLEQQINLLKSLKQFNVPTLVIINKIDMASEEQRKDAVAAVKSYDYMETSCEQELGIKELKEILTEL